MEGIDKNTFKQIFYDYWDAFKQTHPKNDCPDYNDTIQKMLDWGDPEKRGFVQYRSATVAKYDASLLPANPASAFPAPRDTPIDEPNSSAVRGNCIDAPDPGRGRVAGYYSFRYQAASWNFPRRIVAKVE